MRIDKYIFEDTIQQILKELKSGSLNLETYQETVEMIESCLQSYESNPEELPLLNSCTLLHIVALSKNYTIFDKVLNFYVAHKLDLSSKDKFDYTPLHYAAERSSLEIFDRLLKQLPKTPEALCPVQHDKCTPLHILIKNLNYNELQNTEKCIALINLYQKCNISVDSQDYQGDTALHYAYKNNANSVIEALLRAGADSSIKNIHSQTPLECQKVEHDKVDEPLEYIPEVQMGDVEDPSAIIVENKDIDVAGAIDGADF